jgi:hypothetical protein
VEVQYPVESRLCPRFKLDANLKIHSETGELLSGYALDISESGRDFSSIETNRLPVGASDYFLLADDPPHFRCAQPADSELTRPRHPTL